MATRKRVTFASCNLFNINLPGLSIYSNTNGWEPDAYDKKVKWTGSVLSKTTSDVWGFQELWHHKALHDVFEEAGLRSVYELIVPETHEGGRIICAGAVRKKNFGWRARMDRVISTKVQIRKQRR